ncbi:dihydrodipicolinate synthase family protein [Saliphagus infecundisoli]|uniref:Dihydrodipicolinate synthase family protein n=1 Tax=Saliphagus infecundisoli TaxID=1849069 RepID=A0ABD5QAD0_9EURY|nr:dihydrodipicolinate synthase family protein [Saliphagus infecundisoli]
MGYETLRDDLHGVAFTTATPFGEGGDRVDREAIGENIRTLAEAGADLFIPCGNTGEYYSLTDDERIGVVEATVDAVPADATVVAGAGGATAEAIEMINAYEDAGADAAMVMYPRHTYVHEEGLIDYYRSIAASTDLGVVVYKRGSLLSERVIEAVAGIENVVAVKYAVNDVTEFSRLAATITDVVWLNGVAERYGPSYALEGAEGLTTGIGNFIPEPVLALYDAIKDGDWERAREIRDLLRPFEDLRAEAVGGPAFGAAKNVPVVKYGMDLRGLTGGPVREPLVELAEEDRERVEKYLERVEREDELLAPA